MKRSGAHEHFALFLGEQGPACSTIEAEDNAVFRGDRRFRAEPLGVEHSHLADGIAVRHRTDRPLSPTGIFGLRNRSLDRQQAIRSHIVEEAPRNEQAFRQLLFADEKRVEKLFACAFRGLPGR
eukprot:4561803-Prymnesium_polylepis.1